MQYNITQLANEYILAFSTTEFERKSYQMPTFNLDAYNDYEYLQALKETNNLFDCFDDISVTEKFLKGE